MTEAEDNLKAFDQTGLEGRDEEQSKKDYKEASDKLDELKGQTDDLDAKRQECWDAYTPVDSEWNTLSGQITMWKADSTPIKGIEFYTEAFASWNNETLKDAVDTWNTTGQLSSFAQYAFNNSNYSTRDKSDFMAIVSDCLNEADMPDFAAYETLTTQRSDLYSQWEDALNALNDNKTAIGKKETEVEYLEDLLEKFDELNRLTEALETAKGEVTTAEDNLKELQGKTNGAKEAYDNAVKALQKTLQVNGTAYDVSTKDGHGKQYDGKSYWTKRHLDWLGSLDFGNGVLNEVLQEYLVLYYQAQEKVDV